MTQYIFTIVNHELEQKQLVTCSPKEMQDAVNILTILQALDLIVEYTLYKNKV